MGMINATPWAGRRHNGCPTVPLEVSAEDRARLEVMLSPGKVEKRTFLRGQALLLLAEGVPGCDIAMLLGAATATFPASFLLDAFGRRAALALGASLGIAGGLIMAWAL